MDKKFLNDQTPEWFIAIGKNWIGPLSVDEIQARIAKKEVSPSHFIWRKGQADWQRIEKTEPFCSVLSQAGVAAPPAPPAPPQIKKEEPRIEEVKNWFLYFNNKQYGPFTARQIGHSIKVGRVSLKAFAWREGMAGWARIETIEAFQASVSSITEKEDEAREKRGSPRKRMLARIFLSNDQAVSLAVCRDISISGMQVLSDEGIPGDVGSQIKLNVSPIPDSGDEKSSGFKPFVAEGTIVRRLQDGRGFSFRFSRLTDSARRSIETYIQTSA